MVVDGTIGGALRCWGLSYIPEYDDMEQEKDDYLFLQIASQIEKRDYYSFKNRTILLKCLSQLDLIYDKGYSAKESYPYTILEIGIGREDRFLNTSTSVLAGIKNWNVRYTGIDKEDRSYLRTLIPNVVLIQDSSENALETLKDWGVEMDLLHIDGSHSVNNVLIDWEFTEFVKDTGIIVLHDIKCHPGPRLLVDAIDRDIYTVHKMFLDDPKDFGMAVVYKKENEYDAVCS